MGRLPLVKPWAGELHDDDLLAPAVVKAASLSSGVCLASSHVCDPLVCKQRCIDAPWVKVACVSIAPKYPQSK